MSGQMTVAEAGKKGGESTSRPKQEAARSNGAQPKRKKRIETLVEKKQ